MSRHRPSRPASPNRRSSRKQAELAALRAELLHRWDIVRAKVEAERQRDPCCRCQGGSSHDDNKSL
jgi:hypothetical protein